MNTETMGLDFVRTFVKVGQSNTMAEASKKTTFITIKCIKTY